MEIADKGYHSLRVTSDERRVTSDERYEYYYYKGLEWFIQQNQGRPLLQKREFILCRRGILKNPKRQGSDDKWDGSISLIWFSGIYRKVVCW